MDKISIFLKKNKFNFIILILYLIITIYAMINHEIWRDEAQAWCLVRDMNLSQLFNAARIEGHPMLWYLTLLPFAKAGLDVLSMQIISLIFVFIAVIYFVFKSPFNYLTKTIIIFSSGLLYYLPIIARNYSIIPIFLFLAAGLYAKRKENPILYALILIFLSNTHLLMLGFSFIMAAIFCYELIKENHSKQKFIAISILILNFLFIYFCFNNMQNENYATAAYSQDPKDIITAIKYFAQIIFIFPLSLIPDKICIFLFYTLILSACVFYIKEDKKIFTILLFSCLFNWWIYYKVWYIGIVYQKSFLLMLIILFCCWIYKEKNYNKSKFITGITTVFFILSLIASPFNIYFERAYQYSGSKQIANYIKENLNNEKEFIVWGYPFCFSTISAYLPDKKLYMIDKETYITYFPFDLDKREQKQPSPKSKYYITVAGYTIGKNYEKIFQTDLNIINFTQYNEIYSIYKKID